GGRGGPGDPPPLRRGAGHRRRGWRHLLLRRAGQGVGDRPRRRALGGLHGARRRSPGLRRGERLLRRHRRLGLGGCGDRAGILLLTVPPLARKALAELLGTLLLVAAVVGSGIAAQRLSPHDTGLELLENAVATGAA